MIGDVRVPWPLAVAGVVAGLLLVHLLVWSALLRLVKDRDLRSSLRARCRWPSRTVVALVALLLTVPSGPLRPDVEGAVERALVLALIAAAAWLLVPLGELAES